MERLELSRRISAGIDRARAEGKQVGRVQKYPDAEILALAHMRVEDAARHLGMSRSAYLAARRRALTRQEQISND